jgi:hypothetical protein
VVEAPSFAHQPQTWRTWAVRSNDRALEDGRSLRARNDRGPLAGETLRLLLGCAAGVEPTADPVERITVNVGSAPEAPGCWWRPGKARGRVTQPGRDGVRVVVRAGESPAHGEGGQQDGSVRSRSGGRA